jgi:hypothetical protein
MREGRNTMNWTRFGVITTKLAVVGVVFAVGFLVGGAVLAISLAAGVSVAVFTGRTRAPSSPDES